MNAVVNELYTRQKLTATWNFKNSYSFNVTNEVRQGGVLSTVFM